MGLKLDSFGYAYMVTGANFNKALHVLWWRQDSGPSAYGDPCAPSCITVRPGPS